MLFAHGFELDLDDLYARMWELAIDDRGDGTRLYSPAKQEALKWFIADLAGTPAEPGKTLPANNAIREQVHRVLNPELSPSGRRSDARTPRAS